MQVSGGERGDHFRTAVEAAPVDLLPDGFLVQAIGLGHLGRVDAGLVADRDVGGLGGDGKAGKGQGCHQAVQGIRAFHRANLGGNGAALRRRTDQGRAMGGDSKSGGPVRCRLQI